jgi:hypothetical protein
MSVQLQVVPDVFLPDGRVLHGQDAIIGSQQPRFWSAPPRHRDKDPGCAACANPDYQTGCGDYQSADLLGWAPGFGYDLDPWQRWWLTEACGIGPDGKWTAFEAMLICSRQNGKNSALEVRELGGLFVFGESMIIHTAHELPGSKQQPSTSGASGTPSPATTSCAAGSRR